MTPIIGVVVVDALTPGISCRAIVHLQTSQCFRPFKLPALPCAGQHAMLQELQCGRAHVAVISLRQEACDGSAPGSARTPDGVLHLQAMVSCVPAALRCLSGLRHAPPCILHATCTETRQQDLVLRDRAMQQHFAECCMQDSCRQARRAILFHAGADCQQGPEKQPHMSAWTVWAACSSGASHCTGGMQTQAVHDCLHVLDSQSADSHCLLHPMQHWCRCSAT